MFIFALLFSLISFMVSSGPVLAISDPLSVPNNKIGLHILFPDEVQKAAEVVNHQNQGSWGYVVIPIQAKDRDRVKWQKFLDECKVSQVIPIIRVATVAEGSSWAIPNYFDLVDFANFLADLQWPVQNRYIILFNEVNRADEYGGLLSPESYTDILNNAIDIFKQKSPDFFILPAGLDNAATDRRTSIFWKDYLWRMYRHQPDIFNKIDGWTSHAYPNPDFSARPDLSGSNKIDSFKYDLELLKNFTGKNLPVFITEAGWSTQNLSDHQVALYYQYSFTKVWSDPRIVAVAPFLLDAQDGPFEKFSFLDKEHHLKEFAETFANFAQKGQPVFPSVSETPIAIGPTSEPVREPAVLGEQANAKNLIQRIYNQVISLIDLFK